MNKRQRMNEQILQNGFKVIRWAGEDNCHISDQPTTLSKKLRRIENFAARESEKACSLAGYSDGFGGWDEFAEHVKKSVKRRLANLFTESTIERIKINFDPRGYAIKTEDDPNNDLHHDFGGYGILAPEIDGSL